MNLIKDVKISTAVTPTAGVAGTSAINGSIVDMEGFDGLLVIVRFGTITAGAATSIKAQQGQDSGVSDAADLLGTNQTIADTDDDKTFYIDIWRPQERYVRLVVSRATQNAVVASAEYIQYGARKKPTSQGTNVSGEVFQGPAEGTA